MPERLLNKETPAPDAEGRAQEGRRQADPDADREENLRQGRKKNQ